jgi:hypothetical protein
MSNEKHSASVPSDDAAIKPQPPEMMPVKLLGILSTADGTKLKVYSTVSKNHVLTYPVVPNDNKRVIGTPVKISTLDVESRRRLGC